MTTTMLQLQQRIYELETEVTRLKAVAERDGLTGCLRRETFLEMIEERRRFGWLDHTMTLAVVDLDHFKKVNDTHGHISGDAVLREVGRILRDNAPEGSLVCRMGGEEFVILMPGDLNATRFGLERLRKRIETTPVRLREGKELNVTASLGAAEWETQKPMLEATADADAALYRAKREGRNRVVTTTIRSADLNQTESQLLRKVS